MTSFITQCPHCSTRFRVSRSQLRAAHGTVRCGACMGVFNAARQLLRDDLDPQQALSDPLPPRTEERQPAPAAAQAEPAQPPGQPDETLWIHDDLDLDSLDLDEELAKLERQELELSRDFLELQHASNPASRILDARPEEERIHDESWAEILLNAEAASTEEPAANAGTEGEPEPVSFTPVTAEAPQPPSPLAMSARPLAAAKAQHVRTERIEPDFDLPAATVADTADTGAPRREPDLRAEPLFELEDEPLQLDWQQRKKPWGRWFGWSTLNLLALLALGAQYVTYNYDELSRQAQYRPWFERLCPTLGCELPALVDISQIRSSNLVVRSHPDFSGALVVDAILYNRAPFAQPFPLLEIRFADLNGKLLASRSFKPSEYLSGELAGQAQMPPQVPIHIALDILDPGAKAVNYSLSFHSPD